MKRQKIFFTSDLHFGHENVLRFDDRPFETVEEMDDELIKRWNDKVGKGDIVYVLGDLIWKTATNEAVQIIKRLNGQIVLIKGNHDRFLHNAAAKKALAGIKDYDDISVTLDDGTVRRCILSHYFIPFYNGHRYNAVHSSNLLPNGRIIVADNSGTTNPTDFSICPRYATVFWARNCTKRERKVFCIGDLISIILSIRAIPSIRIFNRTPTADFRAEILLSFIRGGRARWRRCGWKFFSTGCRTFAPCGRRTKRSGGKNCSAVCIKSAYRASRGGLTRRGGLNSAKKSTRFSPERLLSVANQDFRNNSFLHLFRNCFGNLKLSEQSLFKNLFIRQMTEKNSAN